MKYAVVEREHRFLPSNPVDLSEPSRTMQIEDRYLIDTRMRLRTVREPGKAVVLKLGQKVRFTPSRSSRLAHTTIYLNEREHALLSSLPAATLSKTRYVLAPFSDLAVTIDVFHGTLTGLIMAEVDLGADGALPEPVPTWLGCEVTDIEEFTGHALAGMDVGELAHLLNDYRR